MNCTEEQEAEKEKQKRTLKKEGEHAELIGVSEDEVELSKVRGIVDNPQVREFIYSVHPTKNFFGLPTFTRENELQPLVTSKLEVLPSPTPV